MKYYAMRVSAVAIVEAEDVDHAHQVCRQNIRDICTDVDMELELLDDVKMSLELEQYGWDDRCLPYGGDGESTLGDLLDKEEE